MKPFRLGTRFDPKFAEAIGAPSTDARRNRIEEAARAYVMGDDVLRVDKSSSQSLSNRDGRELQTTMRSSACPRAGGQRSVSAYRKLARKWHPDATRQRQSGRGKIQDIQEAYESRYRKRSKYDVLGSDWQRGARKRVVSPSGAAVPPPVRAASAARPSARARSFDLDMFFQNIGKRPRAARRRVRAAAVRGEDLGTTLDLTLNEAYSGGKKALRCRSKTRARNAAVAER